LLILEPNHENALLGLALLDQREGRLQSAELQLTALVERYPEKATYLQARADVLVEQKLLDLALLDLEEAIALPPADAYLYVARAELYIKMKRRAAAKADLDKAVALGLSRVALGDLYQQCE
jgi:predicted Zn-dependent protease